MAIRRYSNTASAAALAGAVAAVDTTMTVSAFAGFPSAPFTAVLERDTPNEEIILVTAVGGTTLTVSRGFDGTTAKSHAAGAELLHVTTAIDYTEANAHVNATASVHGATGSLVGTSGAQTLTSKTLTAPVLTGTTTAASATLSGTLAVSGATTLAGLTAGATSLTSVSVSGAATLTNGVTVSGGTSALANTAVTGTLSVSGATTLAGLTATTIAATGAATVGGALTVTGTATAAAATTSAHLVTKAQLDAAVAAAVASINTTDTGWVNLSLAAGWTIGGEGARYRVRGGVATVSVHAQYLDTLPNSYEPLLLLPAEARPAYTMWALGTWGGVEYAEVKIPASGSVVTLNQGNTINGLAFTASWPVGNP